KVCCSIDALHLLEAFIERRDAAFQPRPLVGIIVFDPLRFGTARPEGVFDLGGYAIKIVLAADAAPAHRTAIAVSELGVGRAPGLEDLSDIDKPAALLLVEFCEFHEWPKLLICRSLPELKRISNEDRVNLYISIS